MIEMSDSGVTRPQVSPRALRGLVLAMLLAVLLPSCAHAPASIGVGSMSQDGVITLYLVARDRGAIGDAILVYKPSDPGYDDVKSHIGLEPGDSGKSVPPWP